MHDNQERVCAWCRHEFDDTGKPVRRLSDEEYARVTSHGICRECARKEFADAVGKDERRLGAVVAKAVYDRDATKAGAVSDYCRFKLGMTYNDTYCFVRDITGVELADWDSLVRESEEEY